MIIPLPHRNIQSELLQVSEVSHKS